ncbi:MAG: glycoside hydrolase family 3 C-terminal domain-containing protein [Melioribacteraceae bacterium]|nr:glycoside hydrolase family 3 C-terminal domain-containing protein [Melioribacteraceae bacterium]
MKTKMLFALLISSIIICNCSNEEISKVMPEGVNILSGEEAAQKADSVLALMTLEEKIAYTGGDKIFFLRGIERLGLPPVYFTDATQGIHVRQSFTDNGIEYDLKDFALEKSTGFPCAISLAATWNPDLSYNYAKSIGEECRAGGIGVLLGPGMNIYRNSQCGRNFEYFGEDPFLAARMVEQYVTGVQSTGTVSTIKHFVANNTDFFRRKCNTIIDERTLNEIYLPAFKAGVDADSKAAMTAYNLINGEWCGQSDYVINHLLKGELGFKGLVMTDWWAVTDGEKLVKSGQDLEMPYHIALKNAKELLEQGKIEEKEIDRMVKSILKMCFEMGLYERKKETKYYDTFPKHVETALNTAREGIVLLKNENNILPIKTDVKTILLTGDFVEKNLNGGGSGEVEGYDLVTMLKAIKDEFGEKVKFVKDASAEEIKKADIVLCNVGTADSEGYDRPFALPKDQEEKVKLCVENNPNTVVIVTSGSGIRMTDWNDKSAAILYSWYLGQIGNVAIAEILSGKTNPSGKLPMTIEREFNDSPAYGYMNGEDFYVGWNSEGEDAHPIYDLEYKEGVFVGYRWYENKNIKTLYPFGHGLSYSKIEYIEAELSDEKISGEDELTIKVTLKNNSGILGSEVVQLYVEDVESSIDRPIKELKGFAKVTLKGSEENIVELTIDKKDLSFWNPKTKSWFAEKGKFKLHIGSSSQDIKLVKEIELI